MNSYIGSLGLASGSVPKIVKLLDTFKKQISECFQKHSNCLLGRAPVAYCIVPRLCGWWWLFSGQYVLEEPVNSIKDASKYGETQSSWLFCCDALVCSAQR